MKEYISIVEFYHHLCTLCYNLSTSKLHADLIFVLQIAEIVGYAPIRVYEVATFYSMFNRQPVIMRLCYMRISKL